MVGFQIRMDMAKVVYGNKFMDLMFQISYRYDNITTRKENDKIYEKLRKLIDFIEVRWSQIL